MPEEQKPENTSGAGETTVVSPTQSLVSAPVQSAVSEPNPTTVPVTTSAAAPKPPVLGHNDTQLRAEATKTEPKIGFSRAWAVVLLTALSYVLAAGLPQLLYVMFLRPEHAEAPKTMADIRLLDWLGPLISMAIGYFVAPAVAVFVIAYLVRHFAKAKQFANFLYIILTAIAIYAAYYMFFIGVMSFAPSTYETLAPIGIIIGLVLFAPVYYTALYFLLKYIRIEKYKFDPDSPEYASYQLLENTNLLCRLLSYVGVIGAALIPFLVSVY